MRRPRFAVPIPIRGLNYNPTAKAYTIEERGITYHLQLEHTRLLKEHFKGNSNPSSNGHIAEWFSKLDNEIKKEIMRTGNVPDTTHVYFDGRHADG